jgi:hypothetical protein
VALIATLPVANPETTPLLETLTIRGSEELHVTLPLTFVVKPLEQFAVAVSCVVPPISTVGCPGEIEIDLTVWAWLGHPLRHLRA